MNTTNILKEAISPYAEYCDGYGNPGASGKNYVLCMILSIGKVKVQYGSDKSDILDEINAFDKAETHETYIGQVSMSRVSSFCGPQGLIWGLDIAKHPDIRKDKVRETSSSQIPVYSMNPLLEASHLLLGSEKNRRFPIIPGAHVPSAWKEVVKKGPSTVYVSLAIGIPENRDTEACLIMEDTGYFSESELSKNSIEDCKKQKLESISDIFETIKKHHSVKYKHIYVKIITDTVQKGEIASAIVTCPYISIAQKAVEAVGIPKMDKVDLFEWDRICQKTNPQLAR